MCLQARHCNKEITGAQVRSIHADTSDCYLTWYFATESETRSERGERDRGNAVRAEDWRNRLFHDCHHFAGMIGDLVVLGGTR